MHRIYCFALSLFVVFGEVSAEISLDSSVNEALEAFRVPGMAVGVVAQGQVLLAKGYGYRDLEQGLPATENTLFAIASCTKAFTTMLLGQLVEEGKMAWDDPVIDHIPEFRLMDPYATLHTTIRDLVSHRTGLAAHDLLWQACPEFTRSHIIKALPYLEPIYQFREKLQYNNLMYVVAGLIIEKVTGQTWEEALASRIFIPLNMVSSIASNQEIQNRDDFSIPYEEIGGVTQAVPFRNLHFIAPAGAIHSNISDMLKWVELQLSDGKPLIGQETLEEMHTLQMPMVASNPDSELYNFGYGLGWCTGIYRGHYYLHHDGGIHGFISHVALIPQKKIGIVILCNNSSGGPLAVDCITRTILDQLLGFEDPNWLEMYKNAPKHTQPPETDELIFTPSRPLQDYVGYYKHPAYGIVRVKLENDKLSALYGTLIASLIPKSDGLFNGKMYEPHFGDQGTVPFSFSSNISGAIYELSILLDPTVKPILFKKLGTGA